MMLKDPKRYPFLKDALRMGLQRAAEVDFVCLVKPGTEFEPRAEEALMAHQACYAYRINSNGDGKTFQPVGDVFCATKPFWQSILPEIPDLVLGQDHFWGHVLAALFRMHGAVDLTGIAYRKEIDK